MLNYITKSTRKSLYRNSYHFSTFTELQVPTLNKFQEICLNGNLVDKSSFIEQVISRLPKGQLITRPKNWGKSTNLQMLASFFGAQLNVDNVEFNKLLFLGGNLTYSNKSTMVTKKNIANNKTIVNTHFSKYPVILLDFSNILGKQTQNIEKMFQIALSTTYLCHIDIVKQIIIRTLTGLGQNSDPLDSLDQLWVTLTKSNIFQEQQTDLYNKLNRFMRMIHQEGDIGDIHASISDLAELLSSFYQRPCILLIDDYDAAFNCLLTIYLQDNDKTQIIQLGQHMEIMFRHFQKANPNIFGTVAVGVMELAKNQYWNSWKNIRSNNQSEFANSFGYTKSEITTLLKHQPNIEGLRKQQLTQTIKKWYNGYDFYSISLYNPYSVNKCIAKAQNPLVDITNCTRSYWNDFDSNKLLTEQLKHSVGSFKVLKLLNNTNQEGHISVVVNHLSQFQPQAQSDKANIAQNTLNVQFKADKGVDLATIKKSHGFYELCIHLGYLVNMGSSANPIGMQIPNREMQSQLQNILIPAWLNYLGLSHFTALQHKLNDNLQQIANVDNQNSYLTLIEQQYIPLLNELKENDPTVIEHQFNIMLSGLKLFSKMYDYKVNPAGNPIRIVNALYQPRAQVDGQSLVFHCFNVSPDGQQVDIDDGLWQIFENEHIWDDITANLIIDHVIVRSMKFQQVKHHKYKKGLKYTQLVWEFIGVEYNLTVQQCNQVIELFGMKSSSRQEFLKQHNANSIIQLLNTFSTL